MSTEPQPGKAGVQYNIIKKGDPNFSQAGGQAYDISAEVRPVYAMPTGPGGGRKTRTFPRGILRKTNKIVPSKFPSKAPPSRKRSVRLLSDKTVKEARKTAKTRAIKTDINTIRKKLIEKKIISAEKKNIPSAVLRTLYADSVGAGLLN
jgi:hypothetical protein